MSYTKAQEAILIEAAPVTYLEAAEFATDFGVSHRSVISKVQSLGLDYIKKVVPAKKATGPTKAELVLEISNRLANEDGVPVFAGLEKANASALVALVNAL